MSGVNPCRITLRLLLLVMALIPPVSRAAEVMPDHCFDAAVMNHVREQIAFYGPRSDQQEYFGFIYWKDGLIRTAVTSGMACQGMLDCVVNPAFALARIPKGAKVLGEWHTHSRIGALVLSLEDVSGARANLHIRCYSAFYSASDGSIWRWDPAQATVADAMASRTSVGAFRWR